MRNIDIIRMVTTAAAGQWPFILAGLNINVPRSPRAQVACPACGGHDRFRFDDDGRGSHICNQCGAGDGLDLVKKTLKMETAQAAMAVASVLNIDCQFPLSTSQKKKQEMECFQRKEAYQKRKIDDIKQRRKEFIHRYHDMSKKALAGESDYLKSKGLVGFNYPIMSDGSLLLSLVNDSDVVVAAQIITINGDKRLLSGSAKRGAFHAVNKPETTDIIIIAEGLATALSVYLMHPEALTIAAIDAGNLIHVAQIMSHKYPNARIIIAADNDQQEGHQNTGKNAAEKAALSTRGWIALPPGNSKMDWNDFHQQFGIEIATTVFNESTYQPEKNAQKNISYTEVEMKNSSSNDPLKAHIENRKDGVFWVTPKVEKETGEVINNENWLSSPIEIIGTGRDDKDQYLILRWHAFGAASLTTFAMPLADVGEREGWRTLKAGGVNITTKSHLRAILADWLQRSGTQELWAISHTTGWQNGAYIMPDGEIIGTPEKPVLFSGRSSAAAGYTIKGTTKSWQENIARLAYGNFSMMTAIAAALSAPLIALSGADGFGIHFYEQSSAGKTTTANVASSLYGNPDLLRLTWYGTALGLANEAASHNDALMPLDEVGQGADPVSVSQSAYSLFNGVGKLQGAKEGGNRDLKRWRTVAISTGEIDLETFISATGRKTKAGQLVRLLNIPLSKAVNFHEHQNGKQHADALKNAYQHNHGTAGREWIKWLADNQSYAVDIIRQCEIRWRNFIPVDYGEQVHRVGSRFAILEAALILSEFITGWNMQICQDAIQHSYDSWLKEFGTGNKEYQQIIGQCSEFLNAYGLSRFATIPYDPRDMPINNLAGYRKKGINDTDPTLFYTFPATFEKEMAKGFNSRTFAEVLKKVGMLTPPSSGRGYQRKSPRIDGRQLNVYVIQHLPEDYI
ncbi:TOPRIM and DUF927 domain-containing protein [Citrobacter sp. FP75]|uniref:TOPRIM and DUF927 domain-containing protein n=1 Tax=Citrobacter sp. FP75 TaxID=1852949 RepID=UPI001BC995BC|nr:TOPRIM and DUF927 domain-containing protein [Citrobacter sp. FP75]